MLKNFIIEHHFKQGCQVPKNKKGHYSDRPKFGSVPVPAEIETGTEIPVSVPAKLVISVLDKISVQN